MRERLKSLIPGLAGQRVLVAGDVILDEYLTGNATRMSREAPIPVLEFESRQFIPGGAANPAANIAALGSTAVQVGLVGADSEAATLREVLTERGIDTSALVIDADRPTTLKTRIMAQMGLRFPQQVARLDRLSRSPVSAAVAAHVAELVREQSENADAILFSDYQGGLLIPALVDQMRQIGQEGRVLLTADAQGELQKYAGFDVVKCNADDARAFLGRDIRGDEAFAAAAAELRESLRVNRAIVITRGGKGATLALADGSTVHCPAPEVTDVYDTVGAGDTAIAVLTLALGAGAAPPEAAMLANFASGLVVRRVGNYSPSPAELADAIDDWDELDRLRF